MRTSTLTLLCVLAAVGLPDAFAGGPRGAPRDVRARRQLKEKKEPKERNCEMSQDTGSVAFNCKSVTSGTDDTEISDNIEYSVSENNGKGIKIRVKYQQSEGSDAKKSKDGKSESDGESSTSDKKSSKEGEDPEDESAPTTEDEEKPAGDDGVTPDTEGDEAKPDEESSSSSGGLEQTVPDGVPSEEGIAVDEPNPNGEDTPTETADPAVEESAPVTDAPFETVSPTTESPIVINDSPPTNRRRRHLTQNTTETEFEVVFDRIIEYSKSEESDMEAYDYELDTVVQTIDLKALGDFSQYKDNGDSFSFDVSTADGSANFEFTIHKSTVEGSPASANKMKIDVRLSNFPYMGNNTYLALISSVESKRRINVKKAERKPKEEEGAPVGPEAEDDKEEPKEEKEPEEEKDDKEVKEGEETKAPKRTRGLQPGNNATNDDVEEDKPKEEKTDDKKKEKKGPKELPQEITVDLVEASASESAGYVPFGAYTWASTAESSKGGDNSTSSTIEVIASAMPSSDNKTQIIAFSFVGEAAKNSPDIYWDPEAGIGYSSSSAIPSIAFGLASVASILSVMSLFF